MDFLFIEEDNRTEEIIQRYKKLKKTTTLKKVE